GWIAAKVLTLNDMRQTPAHRLADGTNYHATNKWVLFGHHFAAIAGAGPLIGPVLAAQFGFLPGYLWILIGVMLAGSVQDFVILAASIRQDGKSLADIARGHISPLSGGLATTAILFVIVISLAGLGIAVVNSMSDSVWGVFTIGASVPIALGMGYWMHNVRQGSVKGIREATIAGVILLLAAVVFGKEVAATQWGQALLLSRNSVTISIATYGFFASVLPVWLVLCPRDYLSSYMKIGVILVLALGIIITNPLLKMPMFTAFINGGGPIVPGKVFPFVFITIACGAISGYHSIVSSGTTPKMINRETDARFIAPAAMLMEGFVGLLALIAACALYQGDYFAINTMPDKFATLHLQTTELTDLARAVGENLVGRPGGAVSLAVGMAQIFSGIPFLHNLMDYWYHFAIMFEALFILTVIDTGTRIGRFLLQETVGKIYKPFARTNWLPGSIISSAVIVFLWAYFIWTGNISTIWPMFGVANQLLAVIALCVGTTYIINLGKAKYAWVTAMPMTFVAITTLSAGYLNITDNFLPLAQTPGNAFQGYLNATLTLIMMLCVIIILFDAVPRWFRKAKTETVAAETV
ncbi:MAG TPA: carbon starvation protein A, partial [Candidatus Kapabacteria bacterium]|nr:carbon starvation protein A [Candidatus Kapabacteria bacterium]